MDPKDAWPAGAQSASEGSDSHSGSAALPRLSDTGRFAPGMLRASSNAASSSTNNKMARANTRKLSFVQVGIATDSSFVAATYSDTKIMADRKIQLLDDSRQATHINVMLNTKAWRRALRIAANPFTFLNAVIYATCAAISRTGTMNFVRPEDALLGANLLIAFLIAFYFGYGYSRFSHQFELAMNIQCRLLETVMAASACFQSEQALMRLWRYMNLVHVLGYNGLTP
eukprot:7089233-Prymnesium_polylepis.1